MGDVMGVLARGYRCVAFENDPVQFKATAVLIPQLKLVDESNLVLPFEQVHPRLGTKIDDPSLQPTPEVCCICSNAIKDCRDGGFCVICKKASICETCIQNFGQSAPKCLSCKAAEEAQKPE